MGEDKKEKKPLVRAFSAGGVVYRKTTKGREWLLIKPTGTKQWRFPKGTIDKGETSKEAAEREVFEETGVKVEIEEKIGSEQYFFQLKRERIFKIVTFFLMKQVGGKVFVEDKWAHEVEEVCWFDEENALMSLSFKGERDILKKAINKLVNNK